MISTFSSFPLLGVMSNASGQSQSPWQSQAQPGVFSYPDQVRPEGERSIASSDDLHGVTAFAIMA